MPLYSPSSDTHPSRPTAKPTQQDHPEQREPTRPQRCRLSPNTQHELLCLPRPPRLQIPPRLILAPTDEGPCPQPTTRPNQHRCNHHKHSHRLAAYSHVPLRQHHHPADPLQRLRDGRPPSSPRPRSQTKRKPFSSSSTTTTRSSSSSTRPPPKQIRGGDLGRRRARGGGEPARGRHDEPPRRLRRPRRCVRVPRRLLGRHGVGAWAPRVAVLRAGELLLWAVTRVLGGWSVWCSVVSSFACLLVVHLSAYYVCLISCYTNHVCK